jgi:hypothetical protein
MLHVQQPNAMPLHDQQCSMCLQHGWITIAAAVTFTLVIDTLTNPHCH